MKAFSERNRERCEAPNGFGHKLDSWSLSDWMTALTGEVGEAANLVKKLNRIRDNVAGNKPEETKDALERSLHDELADIYIYLDLFAQRLGLNLHGHVEVKFQRTSRKIGYTEGK
jgi:NTP pyrophosphatase (non-canonical NTP hydrolase)